MLYFPHVATTFCNRRGDSEMIEKKVELKLRDPAIIYVDWANVYGWRKSLPREVDTKELFEYFKKYPEIKEMRFYFGEDAHGKSRDFLAKIREIGYSLVSKPVKHILVAQIDGQKIYRRKCDFDMEISIDVHRVLQEGTESFIFLSGDGDFAPLYRLLVEKKKQVVVVYARKHIGREIWDMKQGIFKVQITHLGL